MNRLFLGLILSLSWVFGGLEAATYQPLLEAQQLSAAIEANPALHIIDIRSPADYKAGHIPKSVSAPYGQWRGPANSPGQLADKAHFEQLVQRLGLTDQQPILV